MKLLRYLATLLLGLLVGAAFAWHYTQWLVASAQAHAQMYEMGAGMALNELAECRKGRGWP